MKPKRVVTIDRFKDVTYIRIEDVYETYSEIIFTSIVDEVIDD